MISKKQIRKILMESKRRDSQTKETISQLTMNDSMEMIVDEVFEMVSVELLQLKEQILNEQTNSGLIPASAVRRIFEGGDSNGN